MLPVFNILSSTYLSPTFVMFVVRSSSSINLCKPRFDITVTVTAVFKMPCSLRYPATIHLILSPSIALPFSSVAMSLSASPSKARPKSAPSLFISADKLSILVDPQFLLMLIPSGELPIQITSAPRRSYTSGATSYPAPFAVSKITLLPLKYFFSSSDTVESKKSIYSSLGDFSGSISLPMRS